MTNLYFQLPGLVVVGIGEAVGHDDLRRNYRHAAVRLADPAAWAVAAACDKALAAARTEEDAATEEVGIVTISPDGPQRVIDGVAKEASAGFVSPLRFAAANPGSLAGLPALIFSFRGPTLNLISSPNQAFPVSAIMARAWLQRGVVRFVVVATCRLGGQQEPTARCLLLQYQASRATSPSSGRDASAWLMHGSYDVEEH